jgi:hypothetical protein
MGGGWSGIFARHHTYRGTHAVVRQANVNDPKIYDEANADYEAFWGKYTEELVVEPGHNFYPIFTGAPGPSHPFCTAPMLRSGYGTCRPDTIYSRFGLGVCRRTGCY